MIGPDGEVLIFTRGQDRADWNFEGPALVEETFDQVPVKIIWSFDHIVEKRNERSPEETSSAEKLTEGASQSVKVNRYERNPQARKESIDHHGCQCVVCGFDFEDKYGEIGDGYIEVHHVKPLSDIDEEYEVDPVEDLKPVCPNCHAMIHRNDPPLEIDELQELIH
jgi:predicted HNH restriction endonuclease